MKTKNFVQFQLIFKKNARLFEKRFLGGYTVWLTMNNIFTLNTPKNNFVHCIWEKFQKDLKIMTDIG